MRTLVFDIGGTNTRTAWLTEEGVGEVVHTKTPENPEEAVSYLVSVAAGADRLVGCIAGIVDENGTITSSTNLSRWTGFSLGNTLSVPVLLVNDAELAALGEAVYGAGKGYRSVAYIGLGTGVGTAHVIDGVVQKDSSNGILRGTVITLSDGTNLEERIGGHSLEALYGMRPSELPESLWSELLPLLIEGVENAIHLWSPDVVVLAGSLMNEPKGFSVEAVARKVSTPVVRSELGDISALRGARVLAG